MESRDIVAVDAGNFDAEVLKADRPVLLDVGARWCGPCKAQTPIAASLAREYAGRLKVVAVDAEDTPDVAARYGIRAMPTLIVIDKGQEIRRHVGLLSKEKLRALVADRV